MITIPKNLKIAIGVIAALVAVSQFNKYEVQKKLDAELKESSLIVEPEKPIDNSIKGLMPVDIYLNLENKGYSVDKQITSKEGCFWTCTKSEAGLDYYVRVASMNTSLVDEVRISATINGSEPNKQIIAVKPFLKYVSSFQYQGSDANKVANWIEENFNKEKSVLEVSGVQFTINASKFNRVINVVKIK